jgi:hypothetical protein
VIRPRLAIALGAVILVAGVVAGRERPAVEVVEPRAARAAPAPARGGGAVDLDIDLGKLRRGVGAPPERDPFAATRTPAAKQAAAAAPQAPEKPAAPPLPFQYIGKWTQGDKTEVLLMRDGELVAIDGGQKLGEYRVEHIGDTQISFTYLPLKMKQTLDLPSVN